MNMKDRCKETKRLSVLNCPYIQAAIQCVQEVFIAHVIMLKSDSNFCQIIIIYLFFLKNDALMLI